MSNLSISKNGLKFLEDHEGFSLRFYGDSKGYPTVGCGHLITRSKVYAKNTTGNPNSSLLSQKEADDLSKSLNLGYTSPITKAKADSLLTSDSSDAVALVNKQALPSGAKLSQSQFDALVSLTFNGGNGALTSNDVQTMLKNPQIYPTFTGPLSPSEIDTCSRLVSKAFSYDRSLQPRRNDEATLFCKGMKYTHKYPVYTL